MVTTIDAVLEEMYLPRMREMIGLPVGLLKTDGIAGKRRDDGYEWTFGVMVTNNKDSFGRLFISDAVVEMTKDDPGAFARALDAEMQSLVKDLKAHIDAGAPME